MPLCQAGKDAEIIVHPKTDVIVVAYKGRTWLPECIATLCGSNIHSESHTHMRGFCLGVRWGIGHSIGLIVVGGILIAIEESSGGYIGMDPMLRMILEGFVGVFMLALGAYGLFMAEKNNKHNRESVVIRSQLLRDPSSVTKLKLQELELQKMEFQEMEQGMDHSYCDRFTSRLNNVDIASEMEDVLETDSNIGSVLDLSGRSGSGGLDLSGRDSLSEAALDYLDSTAGLSKVTFVAVPSSKKYRKKPSTGSQSGRGKGRLTGSQYLKSSPRSLEKHQDDDVSTLKSPASATLMTAASLLHKHTAPDHSITRSSGRSQWCWGTMGQNCFDRLNPGILALFAGLVHGVAGPGGVLGVIPAVELRNAQLAAIYLGSFCLTSTLVMGGFAAFYGTLSEWLAGGREGQSANRVFMVEVGSALLSVCVGCIWLLLLVIGKLDEVFP